MHLDLEHAETVHPGHEAGQCGFARTAHPDQQQVALRLAEDTVNAEHMVQYFVKQHELDV